MGPDKLGNLERSMRRAKKLITDIVLLNDFDYFITLTFDSDKVVSRYDYDSLKKRTLKFFNNQSNNHGIKYIIVPELHKDGALHWHGFIKGLPSENLSFYKRLKEKELYNWGSWHDSNGYTTLVKIDKSNSLSYVKIASYISKYITKSNKVLSKYYYSSSDLIRQPLKIPLDSSSIDEDFFTNCYENEFCQIKDVFL